jgi:hypothetical protein
MVPGGVGVIVDTNGHLGTLVSSERFKEAIKPMDEASEVIFALKPVTFCYKHDFDPDGIPQFGLVAEEVEKVNPDLVKEHHQVQDLKATAAEQQKQIEALTAGLQKVSARLELSKHATQTALNDQ